MGQGVRNLMSKLESGRKNYYFNTAKVIWRELRSLNTSNLSFYGGGNCRLGKGKVICPKPYSLLVAEAGLE